LVDKAWVVKVADFGLSRAVDEFNAKTMTACGTPCWTAPEVIRNQRYTMKADVYSFGICLWEMLSRNDPYPGMPPYQVVLAVAGQNLRPTVDTAWNPDMRCILELCWDEEPDKRPSFGELVEKLLNLVLPKSPPYPITLNLQTDKPSARKKMCSDRVERGAPKSEEREVMYFM